MNSVFKHHLALVESNQIGAGTRVWAWAHVMDGAAVGKECNIGEHCFIEKGVILGDRVTVKNGVAIWEGVQCEDDVFLGPNAVLTNDLRPRSKVYHSKVDKTLIRRGATIGANATILCGITVGAYSMIGAGSVVTRDVPDFGLIIGNPGKLKGYVCICSEKLRISDTSAVCSCGRAYRTAADGRIELVQG